MDLGEHWIPVSKYGYTAAAFFLQKCILSSRSEAPSLESHRDINAPTADNAGCF